MGTSNRPNFEASSTPGPGNYNLSSQSKGPKITVSNKNKDSGLAYTSYGPGPGNYETCLNSVFKNPNSYTMGAKYESRGNEDATLPGPGSYNLKPSADLKSKGVSFGGSKRRQLDGNETVPGPGSY